MMIANHLFDRDNYICSVELVFVHPPIQNFFCQPVYNLTNFQLFSIKRWSIKIKLPPAELVVYWVTPSKGSYYGQAVKTSFSVHIFHHLTLDALYIL